MTYQKFAQRATVTLGLALLLLLPAHSFPPYNRPSFFAFSYSSRMRKPQRSVAQCLLFLFSLFCFHCANFTSNIYSHYQGKGVGRGIVGNGGEERARDRGE